MQTEILIEYMKSKKKVKLNLKNGGFLTGYIAEVDKDSILFNDKFGNKIPIALEAIAYIIPVGDENGRQ